MSVYDKAHELARAISQSNEYLDLKNAFERIENDEEAKNMY
ncbi:MAG TPA: YlbF family regulator, partial [Thermoanaerobacterales bacterium]|nr:YlbF family regulator [Thermoanaerobacterales bacterium]